MPSDTSCNKPSCARNPQELKGILDLERLTSRITLGLATPRELVALRKSLGAASRA